MSYISPYVLKYNLSNVIPKNLNSLFAWGRCCGALPWSLSGSVRAEAPLAVVPVDLLWGRGSPPLSCVDERDNNVSQSLAIKRSGLDAWQEHPEECRGALRHMPLVRWKSFVTNEPYSHTSRKILTVRDLPTRGGTWTDHGYKDGSTHLLPILVEREVVNILCQNMFY